MAGVGWPQGGGTLLAINTFQQFCVKRGLTVNLKKTKVMVFNFVDPCQEFVFKGDTIEHV